MYATTTETPPAVPNSVEPSPATASPQPHTMVEIMALSHESDADAMVAALSRHGYQVAVLHQPQDKLIHLDVGPFANNQDAEAMRQKLLLDGYNATIR
jgi:cell division septation protein DedD